MSAQPAGSEAYAALDDPAQQAGFTRPAEQAGLLESWLRIEGMTCTACAQSIEAGVAALPGVYSVAVSVAAGRARIVWDPTLATVSRIFAAIAALRYAPFPVRHVGREIARREERRRALWRLFVAGFCMMQVMMYASPAYFAAPGEIDDGVSKLLGWASWMLSLPVLLFSAQPFLSRAWADLRQRRIGMDVPVALGILVTFVASSAALFGGETRELYFDSLTMFVFFLLGGRYLETLARSKAAASLDDLASRLPEQVERFSAWPKPQSEQVSLHRLAVGDVLRVAAGQAFPADGVVLDGGSDADESLLTGEGRFVAKTQGDAVVAGSHNLHAPLVIRVERLGQASRFGQIVTLMERAALDRPLVATLADRYARVFLVAVLLLAAFAGLAWWFIDPSRALWIAVSVLIVTCPCAFSLAAPVSLLAASGTLARRGVLVCRSAALETLAGSTHVVFDKTGTLSDALSLVGVDMLRRDHEQRSVEWFVSVAAALEAGSLHPIAKALKTQGASRDAEGVLLVATHLRESRGAGVEGRVDGRLYRLGTPAFAWPEFVPPAGSGQIALLADQRGPLALFRFEESLRADAPAALASLRERGVALSILSGDRQSSVSRLAGLAGIANARGGQTPEDKLAALGMLQSAQGARRPVVVMVGDGINDGPVLARADVSVAMGSGAPLSQSQADLVLSSDRLGDLPYALDLARRMQRVIRQNLWWAAGYNAVCVPLAFAGLLSPWLAGLGMAASSLLVVLNALRLTR